MRKLIIVTLACLASIIAVAQDNGNTIANKTEYPTEEFHRVLNKSVANVIVNTGDKYSIKFICDDKTLNRIGYSVNNGTLEIFTEENSSYSNNNFCKIEVTTTSLNEFINEGVGKAQVNASENPVKIGNLGTGSCEVTVDCPSVSIDNSGIGAIRISGTSKNTRIINSGTGNINAKNLISDNASVDNSGIGNVEVFADSTISVNNDGIGKVTVYGSPKTQKIGSGSISLKKLLTNASDDDGDTGFEIYGKSTTSIDDDGSGTVVIQRPSDNNTTNGDTESNDPQTNNNTPTKTKKVKDYIYIGAKWGFNNYLENGKFAQGMYKVKPWGSWEAGITIGNVIRFGKWFRLPTEISFTWFNFKFSEPSVRYATDSLHQPYLFYDTNPDISYMKSKLSAPYINFELCPTFVIVPKYLSIGVGGYVGYNIGGRNKFKYITNGGKEKDHIKASCFEAFRYGVKAEINLRYIAFYATYDLSKAFNNLTAESKQINVNPICFGLKFTLIGLRR
ncbi:MAG: DUF2807 domain-containing protein [Bacteroidales bacterium]|nr:DUF2807 domain-containing protein [Bacteroidales bacterium]